MASSAKFVFLTLSATRFSTDLIFFFITEQNSIVFMYQIIITQSMIV